MITTADLVAGFSVPSRAARVAAWLAREHGTGRLLLWSYVVEAGAPRPELDLADAHVLYDDVALLDSFAHVEIEARLDLDVAQTPPGLAGYFDELRTTAQRLLRETAPAS